MYFLIKVNILVLVFVELIFLCLSFETQQIVTTIKSDYNLMNATLESNEINGTNGTNETNETNSYYSQYFSNPNITNYNALNNENKVTTYSAIPSSFAILVNFGIDGRKRTLFSSNANAHDCGDKQIWDPFNNQCRQLYCSAHFTLVDFKCVETNDVTTNITKPSVSFLDSQSKFVNITLGFTLNISVSDPLIWIKSHDRSFSDEFTTQFADSFAKMSTERIVNVTYVRSSGVNRFEVNFALLEGSNKSEAVNNDAIVNVMSTTISQNGLSFNLYESAVKAYSIHTTISEMTEFCNRYTDMPMWYWNSEFTIITNGNITYLYVNQTGRKYNPGEYMAGILYVQKMDMSDNLTPNRVNVSSNAVVCETQTLINESCPQILLNHDEYEWINDGSQLRTKSGQIHDHYELAPNQSVKICFISENSDYISDLVEAILSTVLIIISITALTCVLVTYMSFESLRSTINGFNTINLAFCLELMQLLFLTNQYILNCRVAAILLHFMVLDTMSWSSVIAYDMFRTFGKKKVIVRDKNGFKIRFMYWFIANTFAALIIVISIMSDIYGFPIAPDYGPLVESSACWIRNSWATFVYFGVPLTLNILVNLTLYLRTVCRVRIDLKTSDNLRKITRIPSDSSESSNGSSVTSKTSRTTSTASLTTSSRPNQVLIFTRLGVLMGFTWIIALIIAFIPQEYEKLLKTLSYLFVICNTSQGLVLFIAFLCNARVAKLWTNLFHK